MLDGTGSNHCSIEKPWQQAAIATAADGTSADLFWQWGDKLSNGQQTANDGNTIYWGSSDAQCLVVDHMKDVAPLSS